MMVINNFDILWNGNSKAIFATKVALQEFIDKNCNQYARVMICVLGNPRYVKWKSAGAGLYKVWTEENE